jgi:hypothetical protein
VSSSRRIGASPADNPIWHLLIISRNLQARTGLTLEEKSLQEDCGNQYDQETCSDTPVRLVRLSAAEQLSDADQLWRWGPGQQLKYHASTSSTSATARQQYRKEQKPK